MSPPASGHSRQGYTAGSRLFAVKSTMRCRFCQFAVPSGTNRACGRSRVITENASAYSDTACSATRSLTPNTVAAACVLSSHRATQSPFDAEHRHSGGFRQQLSEQFQPLPRPGQGRHLVSPLCSHRAGRGSARALLPTGDEPPTMTGHRRGLRLCAASNAASEDDKMRSAWRCTSLAQFR